MWHEARWGGGVGQRQEAASNSSSSHLSELKPACFARNEARPNENEDRFVHILWFSGGLCPNDGKGAEERSRESLNVERRLKEMR